MRVTIGIDPSKNSAVAMLIDDKIHCIEPIKVSPQGSGLARYMLLKRITGGCKPDDVRVVVEDGYIGVNPSSAIKVARCSSAWATVGELLGFKVTKRCHPSTWQSAYGLVGKSPVRKKASIGIASAMCGRTLSADEADALLIAVYSHTKRWGMDILPPVLTVLLRGKT